jgi:hypothetical protein
MQFTCPRSLRISVKLLEDGAELCACRLLVSAEIANALIQALELLGLVLGILRLHRGAHLVLLSGLLVHGNSVSLLGLLGGQVLREIGFT